MEEKKLVRNTFCVTGSLMSYDVLQRLVPKRRERQLAGNLWKSILICLRILHPLFTRIINILHINIEMIWGILGVYLACSEKDGHGRGPTHFWRCLNGLVLRESNILSPWYMGRVKFNRNFSLEPISRMRSGGLLNGWQVSIGKADA